MAKQERDRQRRPPSPPPLNLMRSSAACQQADMDKQRPFSRAYRSFYSAGKEDGGIVVHLGSGAAAAARDGEGDEAPQGDGARGGGVGGKGGGPGDADGGRGGADDIFEGGGGVCTRVSVVLCSCLTSNQLCMILRQC